MSKVFEAVGKLFGAGGAQEIDTSGQERAIREQTRLAEERASLEQQRMETTQAKETEKRRRQQRSALTPQPSLFDVLGEGQTGNNSTLG